MGRSDISIRSPTRKEPIFIRSRNQECSRGAGMFTPRTAVFIATASKYAPITRERILSGAGVTAAARPAIIFSSDQCFLVKCVWARTSRISARARPQNSRVLLQLVPHLLQLPREIGRAHV